MEIGEPLLKQTQVGWTGSVPTNEGWVKNPFARDGEMLLIQYITTFPAIFFHQANILDSHSLLGRLGHIVHC